MNRKTFIQNAAMHLLPDLVAGRVDADKAVSACERLWQRLEERGYGEAKAKEAAPTKGWYASLAEPDRVLFDRFWDAYGHKVDRDKAAKAWVEVEDRGRLAETIVAAAGIAKHDWERDLANRERTRIYAQGWLSGRRWEDVADRVKPAQVSANGRSLAAELAGLEADYKWLVSQQANLPESPLYDQCCEVREKIDTLREEFRRAKAAQVGAK